LNIRAEDFKFKLRGEDPGVQDFKPTFFDMLTQLVDPDTELPADKLDLFEQFINDYMMAYE